ncbi:MAG: S9 family peptidase, partial [bacterium]
IKLDPEERSIRSDSKVFIHQSVESTKNTGYAWLDLKTATVTPLFRGNTTVNKNPLKARDKNCLVFTRENYQVFPDLLYISDAGNYELNSEKRVSHANQQQSEYNWGSIELVEWTSLTGEKLRGLLVKPDGFDPAKQYPMIVNFYERVSDG